MNAASLCQSGMWPGGIRKPSSFPLMWLPLHNNTVSPLEAGVESQGRACKAARLEALNRMIKLRGRSVTAAFTPIGFENSPRM